MTVKSYFNENQETLWMAYVNVRSKTQPEIRVQRKTTGLKTQLLAEKEETLLIRDCEREIAQREAQGQTWESVVEVWELYLADEKVHANSYTRQDYVASIRKHTKSWLKRPASSITKVDVREVLEQMKAAGSSISYQNKMKVIINRVFVFGMDHGLIKGMHQSPTNGLSLGRQEHKKPEILTISEIRKLLEQARVMDHPWYPIWAMALLTGMRKTFLDIFEAPDEMQIPGFRTLGEQLVFPFFSKREVFFSEFSSNLLPAVMSVVKQTIIFIAKRKHAGVLYGLDFSFGRSLVQRCGIGADQRIFGTEVSNRFFP